MVVTHLLLVLVVIQSITTEQPGKATDDWGDSPAQTLIINGEDTEKGEYPFMVRVTTLEGDHMCGGSLISPRIVLTAAHCVVFDGVKISVEMERVVVGDHTSESEESEQIAEGSRIIVHDNYHLDQLGVPMNDVALIVLKEEVRVKEGVVATIALAEDNSHYTEGTSVTVIGWGVIGDEGEYEDLPIADTLQELVYQIANKDECEQYWADDYEKYEDMYGAVDYELEIPESTMCVIDPDREATAFAGDSGGPLFVKSGENFAQIGLVSWGAGDAKEKAYNMFLNLHHYTDWVKAAMKRAEAESWLELHTGANHGVVVIHDNTGHKSTICNDNVGKDEVNAICREQGYKMGVLADVREYRPDRKRRNQDGDTTPFGQTNLKCSAEAKDVMSECTMDKYEESEVPCFSGEELAVKCSNQVWHFKVTRIVPKTRPVKGTSFVKGKVMCEVTASKYGMDLDLKSHVRVGLVIRGVDGVEEVDADMKYKRRVNAYTSKVKSTDEIKEDECFACIAYVRGTTIYTVATHGPEDCPDIDQHYQQWVEEQGDQN